jgi:hypothetical protein
MKDKINNSVFSNFSDKSHELDLMTQRNLEISEVDEDELLSCVQGQMAKGSKDQVRQKS